MYFIFKILFVLSLFTSLSFSNELVSKNLYDKYISINKGAYKILEFEKMIKNIKVSDKQNIEVDFLDDESKPLQSIKIFTKKLGHSNILITFHDSTSIHIDINVIENLTNIINIAKEVSPKLIIKQTNGKIILNGSVKNQKTKDKILSLFQTAGLDLKKDLVDLSSLENPDKMIRVKLYAVEINNNKGKTIKNNWFASSKNYIETVDKDGLYQNLTLDSTNSKWDDANNQRSSVVHTAIDQIMGQAVSLTGGLTGAANYLGKYFNVGLTLNYLSTNGVANVLDETTLLTLENKEAKFLSGGTIYVKVQTTTSEGVPATEINDIKYGLELNVKAKNIVNDGFINLEIVTKSTLVDWSRTVDGIPSFTEKSVVTNVISADKSTIVLGGLINRSSAKDVEKIPLLGDLPILGNLFTSKAFKEGKSELVFFITPEIVDPKSNNQAEKLLTKTKFVGKVDSKIEESMKKLDSNFEDKKSKKEIKSKKEPTSQELHQQRVNEILGL